MKTLLFKRLLDVIFPPRCVFCGQLCSNGCYVCESCEGYSIPINNDPMRLSDRTHFAFDDFTAPYYYTDSVRNAIISLKFKGKRELAGDMGRLIANHIGTYYKNMQFDFIAYVPMSESNKKERTYNQSELIAKAAGRALHIPVIKDALIKREDCAAQHDLDYHGRWANASKAFSLSEKYSDKLSGKTVLLIDDIITTGATMHNCSLILKKAGVKHIYCASVAYSKYKPDSHMN